MGGSSSKEDGTPNNTCHKNSTNNTSGSCAGVASEKQTADPVGTCGKNSIDNAAPSQGSRTPINKDEILGPQPQGLTTEEKDLIRETWSDVENNVAKVGVVMFIK